MTATPVPPEAVTAALGLADLAGYSGITRKSVTEMLEAAAPHIRADWQGLIGRQRWENCEAIDFHVKSAKADDGPVWLWLVCSACGNVRATVEGDPTDLGYLSVAAQDHLERKHPDLIGDPE